MLPITFISKDRAVLTAAYLAEVTNSRWGIWETAGIENREYVIALSTTGSVFSYGTTRIYRRIALRTINRKRTCKAL